MPGDAGTQSIDRWESCESHSMTGLDSGAFQSNLVHRVEQEPRSMLTAREFAKRLHTKRSREIKLLYDEMDCHAFRTNSS
jgi:hypothetical protein